MYRSKKILFIKFISRELYRPGGEVLTDEDVKSNDARSKDATHAEESTLEIICILLTK